MPKKLTLFIISTLIMTALLTACAPGESAETVLTITGLVDTEQALTADDLNTELQEDATVTNRDGISEVLTGASLGALVERAGIQDGATTLTLRADDGYSFALPLEDVLACADCVIAFMESGDLQAAMPEFEGKAQVKGLLSIEIS